MNYVFLNEEQLVALLRRERALFEPTRSTAEAKDTKPLANTRRLCVFLGITEPTVIRWRAKGKIPFIKIGSIYRYDLDAVAQALSIQKKGAQK